MQNLDNRQDRDEADSISSGASAPRGFVLAHLSDVHLSPVPNLSWRYANLKRVLGFLNWHWKRRSWHSNGAVDALLADIKNAAPRHIAVTGDLVNIGLPREYDAAERWLATVGSVEDVSVIPGNHDIYTDLKDDVGAARWTMYMLGDDELLQDRACVDQHHARELPTFPYLRVRDGVALIGMNSAVPTPPFKASGLVAEDALGRLEAVLESTAREGLFRCVMIHHPPLPGQASMRRGLRNADALAALLARTGVDLVLHGHNHQNSLVWGEVEGDGPRYPVIGVASASSIHSRDYDPLGGPSLARYNLIQISRSSVADPWSIEVVGRGLSDRDGSVRELERFRIFDGVKTDVAATDANAMQE
ncbi:MAG: metallophosphoesterase [Pseudomonadota bacterium]